MAGRSGRTISTDRKRYTKGFFSSWEFVLVILFVAINIFCKIISQNYTAANVLREMPKYLSEMFLLFPMAYILLLGDIDISVGATVCLSATVSCFASNAGFPIGAVVLIGLLTGLACGMLNGLILTVFTELPAMIVTLSTMIIYRGIAEIILGSGGSVSLNDVSGFSALAGMVGLFPYLFFLVLILGVVFTIVSAKTPFGRSLYAIGSNRSAAFYSGIKVQRVRFIVFSITGAMAGLCAVFLTSTLFGANTTTGNGFEMDAIAMAVFGGISAVGGKGRLAGGIISAFIIICLRIGLGEINMNPQVILIILGILLISAVLAPNISTKIKEKKQVLARK
ncbi:MAG: ABC transporter permease [Oscillospiraceae bacterium]|jgi:rhamnose transport system permease protein|nr:ABC transporter permease [Oscillospiraceae bacterium]